MRRAGRGGALRLALYRFDAARTNLDLAVAIANAKERPKWNDGDFFGTKFGRWRDTESPQGQPLHRNLGDPFRIEPFAAM